LKDIIKESMQGQKRELKSIFKEEFGMYRNDSTVTKSKPTQRFNIEWDEKPSTEKKPAEQPVKKKKQTFEEKEGFKVEFE
jgi:predicted HNH restriction endonuclease